jgi:hypothetical protein
MTRRGSSVEAAALAAIAELAGGTAATTKSARLFESVESKSDRHDGRHAAFVIFKLGAELFAKQFFLATHANGRADGEEQKRN